MQKFLYDITERFGNLEEALELSDDKEATKAITEALAGMGLEVQEACHSGIGYIKRQEELLAGAKAEIERLTEYKQFLERRIKRVKNGYRDFLLATGHEKVETGRGVMSVPKGRRSVIIDDPTSIPTEYMQMKIDIVPKKKEIGDAIEKGAEFPGVRLEYNRSLQIK